MRHRRTNFYHQECAATKGKIPLFAPAIDTIAGDVFHDQEWASVPGAAPIEQARDVGVIQIGKHLPFAAKARRKRRVTERGMHEFERYLLTIFAVSALGEIDGSHAAATNFAQDSIAMLRAADDLRRFIEQLRIRFEKTIRLDDIGCPKPAQGVLFQIGIVACVCANESQTLGLRKGECGLHDRLGALVSISDHGSP